MGSLRLVFMGSDPIALPLLKWLSSADSPAQVITVFTQPDRPVGRGQKVSANGIKTWALARGLPVHQPEKLTEDIRQQLVGYQADLALVMAYGHILRDDFIATPRLGTFNLHASLLPAYRGASPIQSSVAQGEKETGVSFMRIVRQLDAGPVTDMERVPIAPTDTALEIEAKLAAACVPLVGRVLPRVQTGEAVFQDQDHAKATFCRRLVKEDGALDFRASAPAIAARINGLFPWPACAVEWEGQPVKFGRAIVSAASRPEQAQAGEILPSEGGRLLIAAGEGVVEILRLQRPGGKMLETAEFLRGFPFAPGKILASRPMPPLVADRPFR